MKNNADIMWAMIPAKADPTVQDDFKTKELELHLKQAQEWQRAVIFVDAAHFEPQPTNPT